MNEHFLPGVPAEQVKQAYAAAPGDEIASGKFAHPESSAALAANTFGFFLNRPGDLPLPPGCGGGTPRSLSLETEVRFPWRDGYHPWLDALISTKTLLIGVEAKRFEPFRGKSLVRFSDAYSRPVWGNKMTRYMRVRDGLKDESIAFNHLDAAQLVKHAFALRTQAQRDGLRPLLWYLYAEPDCWPKSRKPVAGRDTRAHRDEIARFAKMVAGDEVRFMACSYRDLLTVWSASHLPDVRAHATEVLRRFAP